MNFAPTRSTSSIVDLECNLLDLFAPMSVRRHIELRSSAEQNALWRFDAIHRAKNLAQLSTSLSNIVAGQAHSRSMTELAGPARTLARTYTSLTIVDDVAKPVPCLATITEIATQLTGIFGTARGIDVQVAGDDIHVLPECRRALALVCSESVINALKYAFPADRPGRIAVTLRATRPAIELVVQDDGVGLTAGTKGQGSGLLDRIAAASGATLHRGHGPGGCGHRVTMRIPMPVS